MRVSSLRLTWAFLLLATFGISAAPPQLGSRTTEEWVKTLDSPQRISGMRIDEVVAKLRLRPGQTVADIGAGTGAFDAALASAVGSQGTVYAVDIDKGLLEHISERAKSLGIANIKTVLGTFTDPSLPVKNVDVALINDVLHHIEARSEYLKNLARYLGTSGRIAVVDFKPGQGGHAKQPEQQISKEQAAEWMAAAGLKVAEDIDLFADKWFVIYSR
jgi:ubiquinone/menaquinone biosynthesis C-methylase UbiE